MDITIIGAGIAGLSTALALSHQQHQSHHIVLLESAPELGEIGAGIQLTPQAIRAFFAWGLRDALLSRGLVPAAMEIRAGRTGEILGSVRTGEMELEYGAPYLVVHRAVLLEVLEQRCREVGVEIRTGARVVRWLWDQGSVVLSGGEVVKGDLLVAADGINSAARADLLSGGVGGDKGWDQNSSSVAAAAAATAANPTGWAAYRLMAPVDKVKRDDGLRTLWAKGANNIWLEDGVSCMTYLVKDATMLNIVLSHRDDRSTAKYTHTDYEHAVDELMAPFEERVQKLMEIAKAGNIVNYPVYAVPTLSKWTHDIGRGLLVGDAAHAMAFWLSMGVSLAVEDGEALGEALDLAFQDVENAAGNLARSEKNERLKKALVVFERARKPRAEAIAAASLHAGFVLHLPDGRGQQLRDLSLKVPHEIWEPTNGEDGGEEYAYGIANKKIRDWCYGFDVKGDIREIWRRQS